ncbi:MAG: sugar phosphate isomerase/epimerase [Clostridia bacterium]|nr:sugar phosphate isomerase/epimerase [Clostridia bacterium]
MEYGLQMYSVRDLTEQDLEGALRQVAALGYEFVEFAGFFGHSATDVRRMLVENGLTVSGAHTGLGELTPERIEETIAYHAALGNDSIIVPWESYPTKEKLDAVIDALNAAQKRLAEAGIVLGYHNHAFEFEPTAYGLNIFEELVKRTQVELEIDTYWVYAAGLDPIEVLESLKGRVRVIHVKDGLTDRTGRALGEGTAPVAEVIAYAKKNGLRMVVESEDLNPSGIEEVGRCAAYLKTLAV